MKILITLSNEQGNLLKILMQEDAQHNKSAYMAFLISQETKRRKEEKNKPKQGRPTKESQEEELPDENEPRTLEVPEHLIAYIPPFERARKKKVNAYDILMLEAKKQHHDGTNAS